MAHPEEDNAIYWYDPNPRTIIPLDDYHMPKRLERTLRQEKFEVRMSTQFEAVMRGCAEPAPGRMSTWISEDIIALYSDLHHHGYAHSFETYSEGELVGGIYGVSIAGLFAGESMFSRQTDASKVALIKLIEHLNKQGFSLFDVQFSNPHIAQFGTREISRTDYKRRLAKALKQDVNFL